MNREGPGAWRRGLRDAGQVPTVCLVVLNPADSLL